MRKIFLFIRLFFVYSGEVKKTMGLNLQINKEEIKKKILEAYPSAYGCVSYICKQVGISRTSFYNWREEDAEFDKAIRNLDPMEDLVDLAVMKLGEKVKEGDTTAIIFSLKTIGKKRGFLERYQEQPKEDKTIILQIGDLNGNVVSTTEAK